MTNSVDPDQTAPIGAVCSGFTLFASILNLSVMLGSYLQQTISADDIFRCIFFLTLLGLKGGCTCWSESILFKMPHCWKSHVTAQISSKWSKFRTLQLIFDV